MTAPVSLRDEDRRALHQTLDVAQQRKPKLTGRGKPGKNCRASNARKASEKKVNGLRRRFAGGRSRCKQSVYKPGFVGLSEIVRTIISLRAWSPMPSSSLPAAS